MKIEPTPVLADDGGVYVVYLDLVLGSSSDYCKLARAALGETLDLVPGSDDGGVLGVALPLEGIVFGATV